jgi:DNA-binding response OmpR family regulator
VPTLEIGVPTLANRRLWRGARILVVEDSYLQAELVGNCLRDWGLEAIGPAGRLRQACELARDQAIAGAILDVKLGESLCFPVCTILTARRIPFVFLTGDWDPALIPPEFCSAPVVLKPFNRDQLRAALASIMRGSEEPLIAPRTPSKARSDGDSG